jgi:hypothetical protein
MLVDGFRGAQLIRDLGEYLGGARPAAPPSSARLVQEDADSLVARARKPKPLRFGGHTPIDLGERERLVV